jgi:hypothetical protein
MFLFPMARVEWCGIAAQKNPPEEKPGGVDQIPAGYGESGVIIGREGERVNAGGKTGPRIAGLPRRIEKRPRRVAT